MKELNLTEGKWITKPQLTGRTLDLENEDGDFIATFYNNPLSDGQACAKAVNNTYHKGIDPEAVPDMKEALMEAKEFIEALACPYIENDMELKKQVKEALQKADLINEKAE